MRTITITGWAKLLLLLPLLFALQSPAQRPAQEIWLMAGKQAVALAESYASVLAKLDVGENAFHLATSPDGSIVAIASYGAAKSSVTWSGVPEIWPEPGGRSQITLVKRPGYEIIGQYQTPFRPAFLHFTPDGSALAVVSLGQVSKNEKKHIAPQVFVLEIASGKLRGQVELASEPIAPWLTR